MEWVLVNNNELYCGSSSSYVYAVNSINPYTCVIATMSGSVKLIFLIIEKLGNEWYGFCFCRSYVQCTVIGLDIQLVVMMIITEGEEERSEESETCT